MFGLFKKRKTTKNPNFKPEFNFVAIDFETANPNRGSICQYGVTIVKNGLIKETHSSLIKPDPLDFYPGNINVHGITENDVLNSPSFFSIWNDFKSLIGSNVIVAHNVQFDFSCLMNFTKAHNLVDISNRYTCSMAISKVLIPALKNYKLSTVCQHLGIELNHHEAGSDSKAAALIILKLATRHNFNSIDDMIKLANIPLPRVVSVDYVPFHKKRIDINEKNSHHHDGDSGPLNGKMVVFTGELEEYDRDYAMDLVVKNGGQVWNSITKKVNMLVVGNGGIGTGKYNKAIEYQEKGLEIDIIEEVTFYQILKVKY